MVADLREMQENQRVLEILIDKPEFSGLTYSFKPVFSPCFHSGFYKK